MNAAQPLHPIALFLNLMENKMPELTPAQRRQVLADWLAQHGVATHTVH